MDGANVALWAAAIAALATLAASMISTWGQIQSTRHSEKQNTLRDEIDRLKSENETLRRNLSYTLRQVGGYHQLEDIYFKIVYPEPDSRMIQKSKHRQEAQDKCNVYPQLTGKQSFAWAEQIDSGHMPSVVKPINFAEQESSK